MLNSSDKYAPLEPEFEVRNTIHGNPENFQMSSSQNDTIRSLTAKNDQETAVIIKPQQVIEVFAKNLRSNLGGGSNDNYLFVTFGRLHLLGEMH